MGGEVSTDFKSSNRIEISRLVQVLLNFDWFRGSPPGWGMWGVVRGCPPHTCTCTCMHTRAHAYDIIGNPRDFPKSNGGSHLQEIIMFTMHACACMHVCVHMCGGHPQPPPPTSTHPPPPELQGAQNTKIQCLELIEIIRFCLKILYLWTFLKLYRL